MSTYFYSNVIWLQSGPKISTLDGIFYTKNSCILFLWTFYHFDFIHIDPEKVNTEKAEFFQGDVSKNFRRKDVSIMKKLKVDLTMSPCNNHLYQADDEKYDSLLFSSTRGLWFGDSGGPLMKFNYNFTNFEVVGVAMASARCLSRHNGYKMDDIYTRVSFFVPWIQKNLENFDDYTNLNLDRKTAIGILILEISLVLLFTTLFTLLVFKLFTILTKKPRRK